MTDDKHTPDSLAEQLDQILAARRPERSDDPLIDTAVRLANAPRPQLSPRSVARIQAQVLNAHQRQARVSHPRPPRWTWWLALSAAAMVILALGSVVARIRSPQGSGAPFIPTLAAPLASLTPVSSATEVRPTAAPFTPTAVTMPTEGTAAPLPVATGSPAATITLEGPVETINANLVTISGIAIQLSPSDPVLTVLQVGDDLHVEGTPQQGANGVVIMAVTARLVNAEVFSNGNGQVWRDNGRCDNPPPAWAPAYGWYRRCQANGRGGNPNGGNPGNGNGGGNGGN